MEELQRKCVRHVRKPLSKSLLQEVKAAEAQKEKEVKGEGVEDEVKIKEEEEKVVVKEEEAKEKEREALTKDAKGENRDWKRNGMWPSPRVWMVFDVLLQMSGGWSGLTPRSRC